MDSDREEQEADEIIRRLKAPPVRRLIANWNTNIDLDELSEALAAAITEEIDKELLNELRKELGK